jgi:hypothetical protein
MIRESRVSLPSLRWIVVDDCSPYPWPAECYSPTLTVARVETDIPHNNPGARNLGMRLCLTPWAIMLDFDNIPTVEFLNEVCWFDLQPRLLYRLREIGKWDVNKMEVQNSANAFVVSVPDFWDVGGYDEDFAGRYGSEDHFFSHCWKRSGREVAQGQARVPFPALDTREGTPSGLKKDAALNRRLFLQKIESAAVPSNPIRFPWHVVKQEPPA